MSFNKTTAALETRCWFSVFVLLDLQTVKLSSGSYHWSTGHLNMPQYVNTLVTECNFHSSHERTNWIQKAKDSLAWGPADLGYTTVSKSVFPNPVLGGPIFTMFIWFRSRQFRPNNNLSFDYITLKLQLRVFVTELKPIFFNSVPGCTLTMHISLSDPPTVFLVLVSINWLMRSFRCI